MRWVTRPLDPEAVAAWERAAQGPMRPHRFSAGWTATKQELEYEADHLGASEIVVQIDVAESDLRLDGGLRANARPSSDLVVVNLDTRLGPMRYPSGRFYSQWAGEMPGWQANVRAVALTLQALRAVDRYGVASSGEQYRGWQALPAGAGETSREAAARLLAEMSGDENGVTIPVARILDTPEMVTLAYRRAVMKAHPDHGGTAERFEAVQAALGVLRG